jgi:putative metal-binding protein
MRSRLSTPIGVGLALLIGSASATIDAATLTTYSSRTSFLAAIGPNYSQANFDGFASGTALTTQVTGLVFSSPNAGMPGALPIQAYASAGAVSAPNLLAGGFAPGNPNLAQVMVVTFTPVVTAYGAYVSPLTPNSVNVAVKVDFVDQTSQNLMVNTGSGNHPGFLGFKSNTGVTRVTFTATKSNGGQQGFKNYGADDMVWVSGDARPPVCTAEKSIIGGVLGFDGTTTDSAPFDTGVASVTLLNATNVHLACAAPFPAACGTVATPVAAATWRIEPTAPGLDGAGTVLGTDASGNSCVFDVTFSAFGGGTAEDLVVCRDTGLVLSISNPTASDAGQIICGSTPPGPADPPYPAGYEPSPQGDPFPCTVFTIKSPIHGDTDMTLKKDGDFEPRLRLLFSRFDGAVFPPFADITESVDQVTTIIPDPTRLKGGGTWSQVKVACAVQAELCNGVDDDGDGVTDEGFPVGGPAIDCDGDGYPQCATTATTATDCNGETVPLIPGAAADCNDQNAGIHADAAETCNGLDDDCDGSVDDGAPAGGAACVIPGLAGACGAGVTSCASGPLVCHQVTFPSEETCNGLDDDCDGSVDEGNPPGGGACVLENLSGVCAAGAYSCATGSPVCTQTVFPSAETCNGTDDDCDGQTDEGLAPLSCGTGACATTAAACVGGVPQTCTPGTPSAETCNAIDDDCDGQTDESLGSTTCGIGACATTVANCVGGVLQTCTPGAPGAEVCNAIDDDCDGAVDEGFAFSGYLSPVRADGSGIYQAGRTIPFKFRLTTCSGMVVNTATATIEVIPYSSTIVGTTQVEVPMVKASVGTAYQYDAKANLYIFNLGTRGLVPGSYIARTRISDGSIHDVIISLR